jgi:hypothetical protein
VRTAEASFSSDPKKFANFKAAYDRKDQSIPG